MTRMNELLNWSNLLISKAYFPAYKLYSWFSLYPAFLDESFLFLLSHASENALRTESPSIFLGKIDATLLAG